ncbi:MAG: helix-turn-helix domain-containing protein [Actinobacteria bacterium]|nr:helix-turn-helix domain-containing protein [Actinomycetota bacterium]
MAPPTSSTGQPTDTARPLNIELTLFTVEEAAGWLSVGRTTVYALLKDGQINSVRIGRLRRIPAEALTAYTARLITGQHASERTQPSGPQP